MGAGDAQGAGGGGDGEAGWNPYFSGLVFFLSFGHSVSCNDCKLQKCFWTVNWKYENIFDNILANNLREFRLKAGMSQSDVAKRVGKSTSMVSTWENAANLPTEHVPALAKAVGVIPESLQESRVMELKEPAPDYGRDPVLAALDDEDITELHRKFSAKAETASAADRGKYWLAVELVAREMTRRSNWPPIPGEALAGGLAGEEAADRERAQSGPKSGAGEPSAPKPGPRPGVSGESKGPPRGPGGPARRWRVYVFWFGFQFSRGKW
jgi:transcriptional regulator with XRE-family HTH domain